jgi:hypothetical protein
MREATSSQQQHETESRMGFDELEFPRRSPQPSAVRAMQRQHGEEPCFATDKRYGCAERCELRKDCLKSRAVWLC